MAFTKIVGAGIHTLSNVNTHNINSSGIITATQFVGIFTGTDGDFSGDVTIDGNLTVNGTTTTLDTNLTEVDRLEVGANNVTVGVAITQSGTGDILNLYDGSNKEFSVADGGTVKISQSMAFQQSDRVTTAGLLGRGSLLLAGTQQTDFAIKSNPHNSNLILGVGVTERLRITSAGRVAIGTNTIPSQGTLFVGIQTVSNNYDTQPTVRFAAEANPNATHRDVSAVHIGQRAAGSADPAIIFHRRTGSTAWQSWSSRIHQGLEKLHFGFSGFAMPGSHSYSDVMVLKRNVGVGIGTNNPQTTLEVVGTGVSFFTQDKNKHIDLTAGKIELVRNDSIAYIDFKTTNAEDYDCRIQQVDNGLRFYTGGQGSSTEKLQITSTGEIRIANGGLLTIKTDAASTYGISEALRVDDSNAINDRQFQIFEYQNSGGRWFSFNQNLNVTTNGSAYTYTQGNYSGSNMIEMNSGDLKIYADAQVTSGSTDNITPTERVSILSDGKIGINSTNPATKLDVRLGAAWIYPDEDGTEAIALQLGKLKGYNTSFNDILVADNDQSTTPTYTVTNKINRYIGNWHFDRTSPAGRLNAFKLRSANSGTNLGNIFTIRDLHGTADSIKLWTNGDSFIGVTTDGTSRKLGIGTVSPEATLDVYGDNTSAGGLIQITQDGTGDAAIDFQLKGTREYSLGIDNSDSDKFKLSGSAGLANNTLLTVTNSGNVGIGSDDPNYTLSIVSGNASGISLINDTEFGTAGVYLEGSRNAGTGVVGELHFYNRRNGGIDSKIKVTGDGNFTFNQNVGIGTNNPSQERLRVHKDGLDQILQRWGGNQGSTAGQRFMELYTPATDDANDYFRFQTGNAIKFRIDTKNALCIKSDGRVGIGTDNPSHELDIESVSPVIEMKDNDAGDSRFQIAQSGAQTYLDMDVGNLGSSSLRFRFAGEERVRLTSAGKVGIGTNNPLAPVDILATPIDTATLNTTNCLQLGLWVRAKSPSNTTGNIYTGITLGEGRAGLYAYDDGGGAAHGMGFWTGSNSGVSERLRITSSGTVGINCTPLGLPLEVKQLSADGGALRLRDADATYRYLDFDVTGALTQITARSNNSHGSIDIGTLDQFGRTTQLYIKGGANAAIGIGTNNPGAAFDVYGASQVKNTAGLQNFYISESSFKFSQSPSNWSSMDYTTSPVLAWDYKAGPGDMFYIGSGGNTPIADQMALVVSDAHGVKIGKSGYDGSDFDVDSNNEFFRIGTSGKVLVNCTTINAGGADPQLSVESATGSNIGIIQVHAGGGETNGDLSGIAFSHGVDGTVARPKAAIALRKGTAGYGKGDLCFYVDNASDNNTVSSADEKLRIKQGGDVEIADGNLKVADGHGIDFSSTSNEGSLGSELLDDYEAGTYTPTLTPGSGSITSTTSGTLSYIKIGRLVQLFGRLHFGTSASNVTSFDISLPIANTGGHAYDTSTVFHVIRGSGGEPAAGIRIFRADTGGTTMKMQNANGQVYGDLGTTSPHINVNFSYFSV